MNTTLNEHRNRAFEHRLAMLAASFTASSPIARPSRVELLEADRAFEIDTTFSLVAALRRLRERIAKHLRRRAAIAELSALSDATLADIGLPRHMIVETVDRLLGEDRTPAPSAARNVSRWQAPPALRKAGNAPHFDEAA